MRGITRKNPIGLIFLIILLLFFYACGRDSKWPHTSHVLSTFKNEKDRYNASLFLTQNMEASNSIITSNYFINNVEHAFTMLDKTKWKDSITSSVLYNYVLPPKINNAPLEYWRDSVFKKYGDTIHTFPNISSAAKYLIDKCSDELKSFEIDQHSYPDLTYTAIRDIKIGSCKELSDLITYILRTYGIPCTQDFTPNYTNLWAGHHWNAIIDEKGQSIPFVVPLDVDTLGRFKSEHYHLGKVYRKQFERNKTSHKASVGKCNYLPAFLNDEYLVDVTHIYVDTSNILLPLQKTPINNTVCYLGVFNNSVWNPIAWGKIVEDKGFFEGIGKGSIYIPMAISSKGIRYLDYPFLLDSIGNIDFKVPQKDSLINLNILRKYPLVDRIKYFINRMNGGYFEVANRKDFSDGEVIFEIKKMNGEYFNEIALKYNKTFRYIRYVSPHDSYCNVSELEFFDEQSNLITGKIISSDLVHQDFPERTKEKAFDGNVLTFYHSEKAAGSWIGVDFKKQTSISKLRFLPRIGNNTIIPGNIYEVFYWDYKWVSLGKQKATKKELIYEKVPSGALYYIKNHTEGKEERIFTYKNEEQIWW